MTSLPFVYQDFHLGLDTTDQAFLLEDTMARDLQNLQGTQAGAITKRRGLVTLASPANTLTSLYALESVSPSVLVGAGGASLYSITSSGTVTEIKTGLANNARWEFISAPVVSTQGPLFGMNGIDTPQRWDGTAGSTSAWTNATGAIGVPNGKYCLVHQNQVYVAGVASAPNRVFVSAINDPTNWDPASLTGAVQIDFEPNDGQPITGLGIIGPYVLVTKRRKLYIIVNPGSAVTPTVTRMLSNAVGCVAHRSIASAPEGTYFLAEDRGVYLTNGSKLTPMTDRIRPTLSSIQPGLRAQASGQYFDGHYYLSVPLNTATNDTTFDYDSMLQSWWKHTFGSNQFAIWHPTGDAGLYSAKATAALVDHALVDGVWTDNGTAFEWRWAGPWQSPSFYRRRRFPTPYYRKRLRQVRVMGTGTVDFSLAKDFSTGETLVQQDIFDNTDTGAFAVDATYGVDSLFGGSPLVSEAKIFGQGVANAFSLVFSSTSSSQDAVLMYMLAITDRKDLVTS